MQGLVHVPMMIWKAYEGGGHRLMFNNEEEEPTSFWPQSSPCSRGSWHFPPLPRRGTAPPAPHNLQQAPRFHFWPRGPSISATYTPKVVPVACTAAVLKPELFSYNSYFGHKDPPLTLALAEVPSEKKILNSVNRILARSSHSMHLQI